MMRRVEYPGIVCEEVEKAMGWKSPAFFSFFHSFGYVVAASRHPAS